MKNALTILLVLLGMTAQGVTVPKGEERLRELTVIPTLKMTYEYSCKGKTFLEDLTEEGTQEDWIQQARKKLEEEPNDLRTQLQLGRLLSADDYDTNAAKVAYEKAAALGRLRLDQRPNDGINLTLLAEAVWSTDNETAAEPLYRRATLVASNDWHCWVGLGEFLSIQSIINLGLLTNSRQESVHDDKASALVLSPEKLDQAVKQCHEASRCFQRAYELAPREFEVLVRRGQYRSYSNWQAGLIQQYRTDTQVSVADQALDMLGMTFSPVARQDYEKALAVRPQSYKLVTLMAWFEWVSAIKEVRRSGNSRLPTLEELPEKSRQVIVDYQQRLKTLSDEPNKKVAAAALTALCILRMQINESQNLSSELQRAVEYDPTNEQAWNMLIGIAASEVTPEKLTALCERRLKAKESARNHLILAKALYKQKRFKEATKQADAAIKLEPEYVPAHLMRGALLLRLSKGDGSKEELRSTFTKAGELIKQSTNPESGEWWLDYMLNTAIVSALNGDIENAKARLAACQKQFPDDARVKEIQSALP